MVLFHITATGCADLKLENISKKSEMKDGGWTVYVSMSNGGDSSDRNADYAQVKESCEKDGILKFWGSKVGAGAGGNTKGIVSATFKGAGKATLTYGNCWRVGRVNVLLNGKELGGVGPFGKDTAIFSYKMGDVLQITEDTGVIKLYDLMLECEWSGMLL